MAALRLVRKWGVPLATAAGAPLLVPVVRAEAGGEGAKETPPAPPTSRMVRPSDLPIYEEPEEVLDFEYHGRERSSLEDGVGVVRKEVEGILEATRSARERIAHIYETGKAHSMATIDYLTDEENMLPRAGAITVGGLAGLVIGARRRGGFIRKVLYTSTGVLTAASLCYPRQAYAISQQVYGAAKNYGAIGYNFVVGVKPQSKASPPPPPETPKEPEKEMETSATPPATEDTPPAPAPTPQLQDAEVRSATALSLPPGKSLIDTLAEQASDVTVWGFRLTDWEGTAAPRGTSTNATTPQDALPTVPEGFGSVGTAATDGDSAKVILGEVKGEGEADTYSSPAIGGEKEAMGTPVGGDGGSLVEAVKDEAAAVREKVTEVEEEVQEMVEEGVIAVGEKVAVVEEKASTAVVEVLTPVLGEEVAKEVVEKVETVVEEAVEKVAGMVEEKVAVVVEEVAKEVEEEAAVVEEVVQRVEETGEKVEKALDVVERVTRAVEKAAEAYPAVPVAEVEKVEKMVEETEAVVENITEATKVVEGLTEEIRKKAEKVEKEAAEVMESKEKRKEVLEEVVETLEAKATQEKQDAGSVVEKQADVPPPQLKEAPQEGQKEVDTPPVAHLTPAVPQEREGLFGKLVRFFSKPDEGVIESRKDEQAASKTAETRVSASDVKTTNIIEEPESVRQVEVEAHSHIEGDKHTTQLPDSEGRAGGAPVGERDSLVEEVVETVKEGAAAVGEKVTEMEGKLLEMVEEGVIAVGDKVAVVEEKASTAVVEVLTPVMGEEEAKEVVGKVETVVGEAVEKVAEMVEGKVAVTVEEAAKEVKEEVAVVEQVVEVVEETGEKMEKALNVVERVTGAVEEAVEKFPAVPVEEVEKVEKVVEATEAAVESTTEAAKEVEGLTEEIREETEQVEKEATEVMESEDKGKKVLEEVVETLEAKAAQEKQDAGSVVEKQADVPPLQLKEAPQEGQKEVDTPPVAHLTPAVPQEREGLFDKLVRFFSKQDNGVIESRKDEQAASKAAETRVSASDVETTNTIEEPESVRQVEVEAHSHIEEDKHTAQLPDSEGGAEGAPVGERDSLVEEVVEGVREGAAAVGDKVTEVEGKVLEMVEEGVIAIGEEVAVVEEKASTAVVEVLTPVMGEEEAKEVVEKVETVVGEAVEKVAEMVEGKVAVVVEEAAKEVEEEAAVVEQVVEVVEETGEKVEKALNVVERVTGTVEEAAEKFRALPVGEVEKVVEVTEAAVESITEAAKGLEGLTEEVRKEMEKVEKEAVEVMESEEKRKEVLEEALETLEAEERQDPGVVVEKQDDALPPQPKETPQETEVDTPPVKPVTPAVPQEREGLFDKLVSFLSKPDKGAIESAKEQQADKEGSAEVSDSFEIIEAAPKAAGEVLEHAKKEQITEAPDESIPASSITQETQETEALMSEVKSEPEPPAPELRESTTEVTGKSEPDTTLKTELEGTEKSLLEIAEKSELETTEKHESDIGGEVVEDKRQEVVEGKEQMEKVEGKKGQVMEEEAGWVMVEVGEKQDKVEEAAGEKLQSVSSEEQDAREVEVKEEAPGSGAVPTGKREGLFDQLVRLFTKDEEKPVSISDVVVPQESVPADPGAGGVPLPGEGKGKELSAGTLGREDEVHPVALGNVPVQEDVALAKHEDTVSVPDVSVIPEDTAQVPDVPQVVEDTTQIIDTLTVPDVTAQIPSLPTVPDDTAHIPDVAQAPKDTAQGPDVTQVPKDTVESSDVPHIFREEVPATEQGIVETVSGELPDLTQTHEGVVASTEADFKAVSEPAGTLGAEEGEAGVTLGHPLEEPTPPSPPLPPPPPPPVEKKNLFDKLASLFQKEEQQQEPQLHEAAAEKVKEPLAEAQEPTDEVKEDKSPETEQETGPHSGESEVAAVVPESPQEESSSVAPSEDLSLKSLSEPTMEGTFPTGSDVPETVVVTMGGKEEEEASLAAAAETTPQQPQVFSPQVQSSSGGELGQQPSGEVSGEASESVAAADTQEVHSTQVEEGLPAIQHLAPPEAAEGQDKSREPGTEPHTVEAESLAAKPDLAKDTTEPSRGGAPSEGSQISITSQGDTFTVKASPNRPSGVEAQGEDQQQAGVVLRPSWLRTEAEVVQEGKDVIVKLEPATPEKDYGQGNPEDSDMYTTRS